MNLINENADVIRNFSIKKLKWQEKGRSLSEAGDIDPKLAKIVNYIVNKITTHNSSCIGRFTSGNDYYHKKIKSYTSSHTTGNAVDITLPKFCHGPLINLLNKIKEKVPGFKYIDEYSKPSKRSTGGHFHLEYKPSTNSLTENYNLGNKVKINSGVATIPSDFNKKIKSPSNGEIISKKISPDCLNELVLGLDDGNHLQFCGITNKSVKVGDDVYAGSILGTTDNDVKVQMFDKNFKKLKIGQNKRDENDRNYYKDPLSSFMFKLPIEIGKAIFTRGRSLFKEDTYLKEKRLNENIDRIKKLL